MSEMVDRVAAAIHENDGLPLAMARVYARVTIKALREPTEAMRSAGYPEMHSHASLTALLVWQRMIDAALNI